MSEYKIKDEGDPKKYWTQLPNLIDDMGLSVYAFRLYVHLKRVVGEMENGECWQSVKTLAENCNMSIGMVTKAKKELDDLSLINIEKVKNPRGGRDFHKITIVDIWPENIKKYASSSPHELDTSSQDELTSSPHELKKNPIKKNLIKGNNNNNYAELSVAFCNKTRIPELSPNPRKWFEALEKMGEAGVEPVDIENAVDILRDRDYTIVGLSSITNTAINEMSRRKGKKKREMTQEERVAKYGKYQG